MSKIDYSQKVLEVKDLKKYFYVGMGKKKLVVPAVDGVTFDVYKREVFGLVGESGCGKTTTGRTIIKLYNPTDGNVMFNGVSIGAGYETYLRNIREIKRELKEETFKLRPHGEEILSLQAKEAQTIFLTNYEINNLNLKLQNDIKKAKEPNDEYKKAKYEAKNNFVVNMEQLLYDFNLKKENLILSTQNQAANEYKTELAKAKHIYIRSSEGIKESAALEKEVVERRLADLKTNYEDKLEELEKHFSPLIKEKEKEIRDKKEVKEEIKILRTALKEAEQVEKNRYKEEDALIQAPDKVLINERIKEIKESHKARVQELKQQIKNVKLSTKEKIRVLKDKSILSDEDKANIKIKYQELKQQANIDIAEQKELIREAKLVNKSKESKDEITKMQMIFQDPISSLNPRMTVREIVAEGLTIQGNHTEEEIDEKVRHTLNLVGLAPEYMARYPHEFSGGQRQRIGVARALIMEPDLIIADEPISSLDVSIRAQVINLLTSLKEDLGLTILFIAHDLSVIEFFCDRIAVMYYGKIVEIASSEEIFSNPMHPYTISLLSAVPQPDPDYEKGRKRLFYDPRMHDYRIDRPELREIAEGHFVYANDAEFAEMQKRYNENKKA